MCFGRSLSSACLLLFAICLNSRAGLVTVFSSGFGLPETISLAPEGFGLTPGTLVVPDPIGATVPGIFTVPSSGGSPTAIGGNFSTGAAAFGGVFAPASFGSLSNDYLAFGYDGTTAGAYSLSSSSGTLASFYTDTANTDALEYFTPVLAPSGVYGGDILVTEALTSGSSAIVAAFSPGGSVSTFATISNFTPWNGVISGFGTVMAPAGFVPGTTSPTLLVSDGGSGNIDWIDSSGNAHLFATVPLGPNQTGLRQMAFAPAGFGAYGGDLFVSVSGSESGVDGTFGSVDVINSIGQLVGVVSQGTVGAPFDPRGLYFASSSQLLIADADPEIYSAPPGAVTAIVPEPSTAPGAALALAVFATLAFARRSHSN